jgi:hypothetical protein
MGGTTPAHALPYPTGSDRVTDGDNAIQALAVKLDAELTERDTTISSVNTTATTANTKADTANTKVDNRARFGTAGGARYVSTTFAIPAVNAGANSGAQVVTFPAGAGFTSAPVVVASSGSGRIGLAVTATTTTTFTYIADNWSGGNAGATTGRYIATGPGA